MSTQNTSLIFNNIPTAVKGKQINEIEYTLDGIEDINKPKEEIKNLIINERI